MKNNVEIKINGQKIYKCHWCGRDFKSHEKGDTVHCSLACTKNEAEHDMEMLEWYNSRTYTGD